MSCYLPHYNKDSWEKSKELFKNEIKEFKEFNEIFFKGKCDFFKKIDEKYKKEGEDFVKIYKNLQNLVLDLEKILKPEYDFLEKKTNQHMELTRKQVALLFLLSFFNIIDESQEKGRDSNNFGVHKVLESIHETSFEFGRCFLNYLTIIGTWLSKDNPILDEKIIYLRESLEINEEIFKEEKKICSINIYEEGSLFDGNDSYFVDFANRYIGGGALEGGCVQEEILFAVQPEAIPSMFFMEVMDENDAIRIDNTIRYSEYSGYGRKFKFAKSAIDMNNLNKIKKNKFIAIDASVQYKSNFGIIDENDIKRDIYKAYIGFNLINYFNEEKKEEKSISTGNWGCGAFGGDHELKFFQQWIAASFAGAERLDYYTYNANQMKNIIKSLDKIKKKYTQANKLYEDLINKNIQDGEVLKSLLGKSKNKDDDNNKKSKKEKHSKACEII